MVKERLVRSWYHGINHWYHVSVLHYIWYMWFIYIYIYIRCPAVRPSVCPSILFQINRLPQFFNMHSNLGFLIIENRSKLGFLKVFGHFLKMFIMWDHEIWFTGILWVLSCVCESCLPWALFLGPFCPQSRSKCRFSIIFWKWFHCIHMKLDL